jgi:hypothetical protein
VETGWDGGGDRLPAQLRTIPLAKLQPDDSQMGSQKT